jgi:predicted transcriptional regulator
MRKCSNSLMEIPYLKDNQFAVGKAQYSTGIVLRNDGTIYKSGQSVNEIYEIFENYHEAELFVLKTISNNPEIECWIVDAKGEYIITYDKQGKRNFNNS